MSNTNLPSQPTAVPVIPRTPDQQTRRTGVSLGMTVGFALLMLQTALPQVQVLLPHERWIPILIILVSSAVSTWQSMNDGKNLTTVVEHPDAASATPGVASARASVPVATPVDNRLPAGAVSVAPVLPEEAEADSGQNQGQGE